MTPNRRPVGDLSGPKRRYSQIQRFDFAESVRVTNASTPPGSLTHSPHNSGYQRNTGHVHLKSRGMSV